MQSTAIMVSSTKLAFVAVALLLLQASWCTVAWARPNGGGTPATMTMNSFDDGGGGGGPSECDGHYHSNKNLITALSTWWYAGGKRCFKKIRITSVQNGRTVEATVVDECDSHDGCKNNIVDASQAVWDAHGLDPNIGEAPVTWSDA